MTLQPSKHVAALIAGNEDHYVDHLAPLCSLLDIPLYVTSSEIYLLVKKFYPKVHVIIGCFENELREMYQTKKALISCYSTLLIDQMFFYCQITQTKKPVHIWCPHGNSEKGFGNYFEDLLKKETHIFCYGPKVERQLKNALLPKTCHLIPLGNYRYYYYQREKEFLSKLLFEKNDSFKLKSKKILYAPTWSSELTVEELKMQIEQIIKFCDPHATVFIKLHPNMIKRHSVRLKTIERSFSSSKVHFIDEFPPIYPILAHVDAYIGDLSSVLFDALSFEMPLILLEKTKSFAYTLSSLRPDDFLEMLDRGSVLSKYRQQAQEEAFYQEFSVELLKERLIQSLVSEKHLL